VCEDSVDASRVQDFSAGIAEMKLDFNIPQNANLFHDLENMSEFVSR
jgi:hypothetical protein